MRLNRDFISLTAADFIVRSAYQMGKTPLLPIFAAALGASGAFLGFIVSVSTLTGLLLKPLIGILSDRWGRRAWLLAGTAFFVLMPFVYGFINTPEQLFIVRMIHGMATAIYGPVTLAYIAEITPENIAENLGWFGIARSGGYIVGPAVAGWMLLYVDPVTVFTAIGLISALALLPVLSLRELQHIKPKKRRPIGAAMRDAIMQSIRTPAIWLSGLLESVTFIALYTVKAFLPVFALEAGVNVALVGLFFSVQEAAHVLTKPAGGRLADRIGYPLSIGSGLLLLAIGLALVPAFDGLMLLFPALLTGLAQALIFPATVGLVSRQIPADNLGAGMGFVGMWQNFGKVVGPVLGGLLIAELGFQTVLMVLAGAVGVGAVAFLLLTWFRDRRRDMSGAGMEQHRMS